MIINVNNFRHNYILFEKYLRVLFMKENFQIECFEIIFYIAGWQCQKLRWKQSVWIKLKNEMKICEIILTVDKVDIIIGSRVNFHNPRENPKGVAKSLIDAQPLSIALEKNFVRRVGFA